MPANLNDLADELEVRAARIEATGTQLVGAAARALWSSVAADAFRRRVGHREAQVAHVAAQLRAAARAVRAFDADVRAEKARLARLLESSLSAVEHDVAAPITVAEAGVRAAISWVGRW